jgi:drug/metabolite transporter (DMT)-like permease
LPLHALRLLRLDAGRPALLEATLLALSSAVLHAAWNLLLKRSDERVLTAWGFYLFGGLLFWPVLAFIDLPGTSTFVFLGASSCVHVAYILALARAYQHGDFSFAYPLARGGGALVAAIGGVAFLSDHLSALAWLAIAIVVGGLATLVRPGVNRTALLFAGLTAVTIGTYTTLDAAGARRSSGFGYGIALVIVSGVVMTLGGVALGRGPAFLRVMRRDWRRFVLGGAASTLAYSLVLAAARLAPVGYVAALRESSVILGAGAGWLLLHERLGRGRLISAGIVTAGLVLLVVAR